MSFSCLASGCSFSSAKRSERQRFAGSCAEAVASGAGASAAGLGAIDFFSGASSTPSVAGSTTPGEGIGAKKKSKAQQEGAAQPVAEDGVSSTAVEEVSLSERETADANALRKHLRIHVYGSGVPAPVQSAVQMADRFRLKPWLRHNVLEAGYHELTRVQMQAIPLLVAGREVLACAPTGSGKTAAFLIPMLVRLGGPKRQGLRAVAIAPTQELARQTHRELQKLSSGSGLAACVLTKKLAAAACAQAAVSGGVISTTKGKQAKRLKARNNGNSEDSGAEQAVGGGAQRVSSVWRKYDVMVCTPLRLVSLLRKGALTLEGVEYLVLDEADKLLELGFLEQVDEILATCNREGVQRALFSATMQPQIEDLVNSVLRQPAKVVVGERNAAADTVEQKLIFCGREDGKLVALRQLVREGIQPPVLIFVQSVERAVQLFHELVYDGLNVDVIHADRTQAQREATVTKFRAGKVWVLIATELVARGMDFKGVSLVINYDFPQSTTSYIHRIGRTGRAGRSGRALTFFTEADADQLRAIANVMKASGCEVPDWMLRIKTLRKDERRRRAIAPISRKAIFKRKRETSSPGHEGTTKGRSSTSKDGGSDGNGGGVEGGDGARPKKKKQKRAQAD